jgi:hypothetical protein
MKDDLSELIELEKIEREMFRLTDKNIESLKRYVDQKIPPGGFMHAVLTNDLRRACGQADINNRRKIFEYVEWLYNEAPADCWGSIEKVNAWLDDSTILETT